jgi:murein DD-endopeptidase MepM/ murein hydrolase activator NlpD
MRRAAGVVVLLVGLFVAGLAAAGGRAGPMGFIVTTVAATVQLTTTASATTTAEPVTTTAPTTTALPPPTGTVVTPAALRIGGGCPLVGGVALLEPGKPPVVLGPLAEPPRLEDSGSTGIAFPADGSVVTTAGINVQTDGCATGRAPNGYAGVHSLSLFGGAITARSVELSVRSGKLLGSGSVAGLAVGGKAVAAQPGGRVSVEDWGYTVVGDRSVDPPAALAVHLTAAHAGLAAGTVVAVAFAALPRAPRMQAPAPAADKPQAKKHVTVHARPKVRHASPRPHARTTKAAKPVEHAARPHEKPAAKKKPKKKPKRKVRTPLTVTPRLQAPRYVFPVVGSVSYGDTYGGFRGDVPGNWHHGDDIFAAVGTPVVAVADGTLNRVGWQRLGGWRLWVRDRYRNQFYYAHLSGYSPLALHSRTVEAGDVIGFIGNTGDAFTTPPHLHFEIHPVSLLRLKYDGAVNPTSYLGRWDRLTHVSVPNPVHPAFPPGAVRPEARYVWRELLAARGLTPQRPKPGEKPRVHVATPDGGGTPAEPSRSLAAVAASPVDKDGERSWPGLVALVFTAGGFGAVALSLRPRAR